MNRSVAHLIFASILATGEVAACSSDSAAPSTVTAVQVTSPVDTLPALGATQQLTAVAHDNSGGIVSDKVITWRSSAPGVATVGTSTGIVTAVNNGQAMITATVDGVSGSVQITVRAVLTLVPRSFTTVSTGEWSACGVTAAGAAYCWGDNQYGELGDGTTTSSLAPVPVAGGLTFVSVSVGGVFACGITMSGAAYCWGANDAGQLGNGMTSGPQRCGVASQCSLSPVAVIGGLTFAKLSAGAVTACGITPSGAAYCWGDDGAGGLGNGPALAPAATPVPVSGGLTVATISAGSGFFPYACAVTTSGAGYCWGDNYYGELGTGSATGPETCGPFPCSQAPVAVAGGLTFSSIRAGLGSATTCGVTTSGAAYCWGTGAGLGDGMTNHSTTPVPVAGGLAFRLVSPGDAFVCGMTLTGKAYCWGDNSSHQLGTGTVIAAATPVPVAGGATFTIVSVGYYSTCGLTATGAAFCWGSDDYGQLGGAPHAMITAVHPAAAR